MRPSLLQPGHVRGVDLGERAVVPRSVAAVIGQPVVALLVGVVEPLGVDVRRGRGGPGDEQRGEGNYRNMPPSSHDVLLCVCVVQRKNCQSTDLRYSRVALEKQVSRVRRRVSRCVKVSRGACALARICPKIAAFASGLRRGLMTQRLRGVLSPVVTPFKRDYSPDAQRFVRHCKWLLAHGCAGLAVFGTNSEANSLSAD